LVFQVLLNLIEKNFGAQAPFFGGASRAFSPKRASRDAPSVCLTGWVPLFSKTKVLLDFFQKIAVSCEARFSGELPRSGKRGLFASEKAPCIKLF